MNLRQWTSAIQGQSTDLASRPGRADSPTRSTPDGGAFVFQSHAKLTPYENQGRGEIYRYAPGAPAGQRMLCVSCDETGAPPPAYAYDTFLQLSNGNIQKGFVTDTTLIPNVTDDGRKVFFQSVSPLVPSDANKVNDVYEWRAPGTSGPGGDECARAQGCLALISTGQADSASVLYGMGADGRDAIFETRQRLLGADVPDTFSLYDAREGGGIPEPETPAPCEGDACQGRGAGRGGAQPAERRPRRGQPRDAGEARPPLRQGQAQDQAQGQDPLRGQAPQAQEEQAPPQAPSQLQPEGTPMIRRSAALLTLATLAALALAPGAGATAPSCEKDFASECFAIEGVSASLSSYEAGAHPDLTISFATPEDPEGPLDEKGLHDSFAPIRKVRIDAPPGLVGDPNTLGIAQQCTSVELTLAECPNGSQIGIVKTVIFGTGFATLNEPLYMMVPAEGSGAIARIGFAPVPGAAIYANITVRSEGDFGLRTEIEVPDLRTSSNDLIASETTLWGVPAAPEHDYERCTPENVFKNGCTEAFNPPGGAELPFLTNPTRCGVPLEVTVAASSYSEPDRFDAETVTLPYQIHDCDKLAFDPSLEAEPTSHATDSPTGLALTLRLPKADGVDVLEPSQIKDIRITMPPGLAINPSAADGQGVCNSAQVGLGTPEASHCPDNAKMAATEFEVGGLPRRMKGAIYLREPEPGNPFRVWVVADDLGAHIKLEGQLHVDKETGQIESIVLDNPQVPLREVKLFFKSGFRAPW